MKKKVLVTFLTLGLITSCMTGCGTKADVTVNSNGTADVALTNYLSQEEVDALGGDASDLTAEQVDGKQYYHDDTQKDTLTWDELKTSNTAVVTSNYVAVPARNVSDDGFIDANITVPFKIAKTNCTKTGEKSVHFDLSDLDKSGANRKAYRAMYVAKDASYTKGKNITFKGVKENKWYSLNLLKGEKKHVKVSSSNGILNTILVKRDDNVYTYPMTQTDLAFDNDGNYKVTVTTVGGGKKSIKFGIDSVTPGSHVVKDGKMVSIEFYDRGGSGIQSVTLNKKSILKKSKYYKVPDTYYYKKALAKGKYTVKVVDKAGNKHSETFTVR